ncbi:MULTISPECIES: hypothetical protein [Helicobacter]|uniref:Uncharacterized protein n=1 Tax=Helicobacter bilis ATCC 43879 TaxID=613026 RepID=C3XFK9_9HELI|nr:MULTISPECIES: hypothetical protein [Helicobacter]EEO23798.1 hypothetical protein HRAG_00855 [Helicobacter bilis ATCC 43879]
MLESAWNSFKGAVVDMVLYFAPELQIIIVLVLLLFLIASGGATGFIVRFIVKHLLK